MSVDGSGVVWLTPRRFAALTLGGALVLAALALVDIERAPVVCPFRLTLALPCPGCGLTRGMAALLRGDLATAVARHPFVVPLAVLALSAWVAAAVAVRRGRPVTVALDLEAWALGGAAALLALWLGRLSAGALPF